jgi:hypothetical protein
MALYKDLVRAPRAPLEDLARDSEITAKILEDGIRDQLHRLKPSAIRALWVLFP